MSPCQKLPASLRGLLPVSILCALAALLLPVRAVPQTDRPARPSPAPGPPAVDATAEANRPEARDEGPGTEALTGAWIDSRDGGEVLLARALRGSPSGTETGPDLSSLRDFLPLRLYDDVVELRDRVVRVRSRVFGRRGIVSLGEADPDGELGRLRLNLQYSPDPGIRVTLVTR